MASIAVVLVILIVITILVACYCKLCNVNKLNTKDRETKVEIVDADKPKTSLKARKSLHQKREEELSEVRNEAKEKATDEIVSRMSENTKRFYNEMEKKNKQSLEGAEAKEPNQVEEVNQEAEEIDKENRT